MLLYYVRRRLGFDRVQWRALPWHDQQLYFDGMIREMEQERGIGGSNEPAGHSTPVNLDSAAGLSELGISVDRI